MQSEVDGKYVNLQLRYNLVKGLNLKQKSVYSLNKDGNIPLLLFILLEV